MRRSLQATWTRADLRRPGGSSPVASGGASMVSMAPSLRTRAKNKTSVPVLGPPSTNVVVVFEPFIPDQSKSVSNPATHLG